ncbi:MAG: hypothetical protein WB621_22995 [Candidatus Acidiferrales bacterium]
MEYKLISGTEEEINKKLAEELKVGWKPFLLSSVLTGSVARSQVMLERLDRPKN